MKMQKIFFLCIAINLFLYNSHSIIAAERSVDIVVQNDITKKINIVVKFCSNHSYLLSGIGITLVVGSALYTLYKRHISLKNAKTELSLLQHQRIELERQKLAYENQVREDAQMREVSLLCEEKIRTLQENLEKQKQDRKSIAGISFSRLHDDRVRLLQKQLDEKRRLQAESFLARLTSECESRIEQDRLKEEKRERLSRRRESPGIFQLPEISSEDTRRFNPIFHENIGNTDWFRRSNFNYSLSSGYVFFTRKNEKRSPIDFAIEFAKDFDGKEKITYKIHFQVKKQYILQCTHMLFNALNNDARLAGINTFKIKDNLDKGREGQMPQIVVYMPQFVTPYADLTEEQKKNACKDELIFEDAYAGAWRLPLKPIAKIKPVQECNRELDLIVQAFYEAFRDVNLGEWALDYPPRFNKQLTPIMYIAGGNGDSKFSHRGLYEGDNREFVKGFTYRPNPTLQQQLDATLVQ